MIARALELRRCIFITSIPAMEMICDWPAGDYVRPRIGRFITWPAKATYRNSYPETAFFLFSAIKLPLLSSTHMEE